MVNIEQTLSRSPSASVRVRTETKVALHLERLWDRNITITTRLVDTVSMPMLLSILGARPRAPDRSSFTLDRILDAYETFANAASARALKVIIET